MISLAGIDAAPHAGVAQSVEQLICNQQVGGSSPSTSSNVGADCAYSFPRKRENSFASSHLLLTPGPLRWVPTRKRGKRRFVTIEFLDQIEAQRSGVDLKRSRSGGSELSALAGSEMIRSLRRRMGVFPSGQRGQTVNLLAMPTVVRIHPPPPAKSTCESKCFLHRCVPLARSVMCPASVMRNTSLHFCREAKTARRRLSFTCPSGQTCPVDPQPTHTGKT